MLILLRFRPDLASFLILLNSGSRGCWAAMAPQSMPRSEIALTTHVRSSRAASARAAALREFDEVVEEARVVELWFGTQEGIVDVPDWAGDVVPTWLTCLSGPAAEEMLDERVEDADAEGSKLE